MYIKFIYDYTSYTRNFFTCRFLSLLFEDKLLTFDHSRVAKRTINVG